MPKHLRHSAVFQWQTGFGTDSVGPVDFVRPLKQQSCRPALVDSVVVVDQFAVAVVFVSQY